MYANPSVWLFLNTWQKTNDTVTVSTNSCKWLWQTALSEIVNVLTSSFWHVKATDPTRLYIVATLLYNLRYIVWQWKHWRLLLNPVSPLMFWFHDFHWLSCNVWLQTRFKLHTPWWWNKIIYDQLSGCMTRCSCSFAYSTETLLI